MDSDRESLSGKALKDTLSSAISGIDSEEDGSKAREKMLSSTPADDGLFDGGNDLGVNNQVGREFKPISYSPNILGETSMSLGLEVEEDIDIRAGRSVGIGVVSLGKPGKA